MIFIKTKRNICTCLQNDSAKPKGHRVASVSFFLYWKHQAFPQSRYIRKQPWQPLLQIRKTICTARHFCCLPIVCSVLHKLFLAFLWRLVYFIRKVNKLYGKAIGGFFIERFTKSQACKSFGAGTAAKRGIRTAVHPRRAVRPIRQSHRRHTGGCLHLRNERRIGKIQLRIKMPQGI